MTECQTGNPKRGHLQLFFSSKEFSLLRSALLSNFWLPSLQYIEIKDGAMARGQYERDWDQLTDLSRDPTSHWSFVVLKGTWVLVQIGSFPLASGSFLSVLNYLQTALCWCCTLLSIYSCLSLLYTVCSSSVLSIFYYYFYVYPLYVCCAQSMGQTTFHCRLYSV